MLLLCAFLVGIVAGLRSMLAPAAVSWAARLGPLGVSNTPLAFMGYHYTPIILSVLAVGELIADKLPMTPSRKQPPGFLARIVTGSLVGATVGAAGQMLTLGLIAGALGAVIGTYGGSAVRARLAAAFGKDLPAALVEDLAAILIAAFSLMRLV
jgi:uncharacterized membrane protein